MNAKEMEALIQEQAKMITALSDRIGEMPSRAQYEDLGMHVAELDARLAATADAFEQVEARLQSIEDKLEGRNRSAPVKRNMTDADALRVLNGDVAPIGHKEAAEIVGLTYAQVYSCRLGFTFKHVHKALEKDPEFKNRWAKG